MNTGQNPGVGRVAWGSAILLAENGLRVAPTALLSFWIASRVGPEGFGLLTLASALAAVGTVAMAQGLDLPVIARLDAVCGRSLAGRGAAAARRRCAGGAGLAADQCPVAAPPRPAGRDGDHAGGAVCAGLCPGVAELALRAQLQAARAAAARGAATLLSAAAKVTALLLDASLLWRLPSCWKRCWPRRC